MQPSWPGRPRILAVDDTAANLVVLDAVLGHDNELIPAQSGAEALAILEQRQDIDVILLDIQMPIMDGYEAAARIKKLPHCADIPIVFVTAIYTEDPHIKRGYDVGGVDYFTKPFDPEIMKLKVGVYASFRQRAAVLKERERQIRESDQVLKAVEELVRDGRKLSTMLEGHPVGVIIVNIKGRIYQTNEEARRMLKTTAVVETDAYSEIIARVLEYGSSSHHQQVTIRCADGTSKDLLESISPLRGLDGEMVGTIVVLQDPTEYKRFKAEFEERATKLISLGIEIRQRDSRS